MLTRAGRWKPRRCFAAGLVCLGALLALAPAGTATNADDVLLAECGSAIYGGAVAPIAWSSGCVGASVNLDRLSWQGWGGPEAVATGVDRYNTCDPDCARGEIFDYPVEMRVGRVKRCASSLGARLYYTRFTIVIDFPPENAAGEPPGRGKPFTFTASCEKPGFLVKTRSKGSTIGPFVEDWAYDGAQLDDLFGPPSRRSRDGYSCTKHWRAIGLTVRLGALEADADPCYEGRFGKAILLDPRWHTPNGVSRGDPARKAAAESVRTCTIRLCRTDGYVLAQHYSDCAGGRWPSVVADTEGGRVKRLLVYSRFCE